MAGGTVPDVCIPPLLASKEDDSLASSPVDLGRIHPLNQNEENCFLWTQVGLPRRPRCHLPSKQQIGRQWPWWALPTPPITLLPFCPLPGPEDPCALRRLCALLSTGARGCLP